MQRRAIPRVSFQPATYQSFQRGVNQVVEAIRPTLGPLPRVVAIEAMTRTRTPEFPQNGGVISRRIIELPDADEDMGAMFIRHVLWRLYEDVGDGTATAAVLFQSIYNQSLRYLVAGGNPMVFRRHLERGLRLILERLERMTIPIGGKRQLTHVAQSISGDPELAGVLGEVFDIIGEYGYLEIRDGRRREIEREYVTGSYWSGGLLSEKMIADRSRLRTQIDNAAILISDVDVEDVHQLASVLSMVVQAGIPGVLIFVGKMSNNATALLLNNRKLPGLEIVAAKPPGNTLDLPATLQDIAILTGGRPVLKAAGETLSGVRLEDLGRARRVWADLSHVGIVGGRGDPQALRAHIVSLRKAMADTDDASDRKRLQHRIGKLIGGSAILRVGGQIQAEAEVRKEAATRTSQSLRGVIREGVVPGGGVSLLACRPPLHSAIEQSVDPDEQAAFRILARALEEPFRIIVANAGFDTARFLAEIDTAGEGYGLNVMSRQVVDMAEAGIWDSAAVIRAVVRSVVTTTALALTIDVLVHRREPPESADSP